MIYLELFLTFLKIGAFTFGGGYAMLPMIQAEVEANGWMSVRELIDFVAVSESTPGSFAVNVSTYVGREVGGIPGAAAATFGVVLPSFLIILLVVRFFTKFKSSPVVEGCMKGLRPAVVGLIGTAVISVGKNVFFPNGFGEILPSAMGVSGVIFLVMLLLLLIKKLHPIWIVLLSAGLGIGAGYLGFLPL